MTGYKGGWSYHIWGVCFVVVFSENGLKKRCGWLYCVQLHRYRKNVALAKTVLHEKWSLKWVVLIQEHPCRSYGHDKTILCLKTIHTCTQIPATLFLISCLQIWWLVFYICTNIQQNKIWWNKKKSSTDLYIIHPFNIVTCISIKISLLAKDSIILKRTEKIKRKDRNEHWPWFKSSPNPYVIYSARLPRNHQDKTNTQKRPPKDKNTACTTLKWLHVVCSQNTVYLMKFFLSARVDTTHWSCRQFQLSKIWSLKNVQNSGLQYNLLHKQTPV